MKIIFADKVTKEEFVIDDCVFNYLDELNIFDEYEETLGSLYNILSVSFEDVKDLANKLRKLSKSSYSNEINNLIVFIENSDGFTVD